MQESDQPLSPSQTRTIMIGVSIDELASVCSGSLTADDVASRAQKVDLESHRGLVCRLVRYGLVFQCKDDEPNLARGGNLFVTEGPFTDDICCGVILGLCDGEWLAWPSLMAADDVADDSLCFAMEVPWLALLRDIAIKQFRPALGLVGTTDKKSATFFGISSIWGEIDVRGNWFRLRFGPELFESQGDYIAWNIALNWAGWERSALSSDDRCLSLHETAGVFLKAVDFKGLSPGIFEPLVGHPNFMGRPSSICKTQVRRETDEEIMGVLRAMPVYENKINYEAIDRSHKFFSHGGPPSLHFEFSGNRTVQFPRPRSVESEAELINSLWWWRFIPSHWPQKEVEVFEDNFAESAFLYELRARFRNPNIWDPFGVPWVRLSNWQRGIFAEIWPTTRIGHFTYRPDLGLLDFHADSDLRLVVIDLKAPLEDTIKMVEAIHKKERALRGIAHQSSRVKRENGQPWELLELMDRHRFMGHATTPKEMRLCEAVVARYKQTCEAAGLNP